MKLSLNAAVFAVLLSSSNAFQPAPTRPAFTSSTELNVFRRLRTDGPGADSRAQIQSLQPDTDLYSRTSEPVVLADVPDDLLKGLDHHVFQAYESLLQEVSQKANDLLQQIEARQQQKIARATEDYERSLQKASQRAEQDLESVNARNSESVHRAVDAYEQRLNELAARQGVDRATAQRDAGMASYQEQMAAAIRKADQEVAAVAHHRATYTQDAMEAYERQLAAASARAQKELASAVAKKDRWVDRAVLSYQKQLLSTASPREDEGSAGMADYERQMNAAMTRRAREITHDFDQRVGQVFNTKDYHASLKSNVLMGQKQQSAPVQYGGMLSYHEQLEQAARMAEKTESGWARQARGLFRVDGYRDQITDFYDSKSMYGGTHQSKASYGKKPASSYGSTTSSNNIQDFYDEKSAYYGKKPKPTAPEGDIQGFYDSKQLKNGSKKQGYSYETEEPIQPQWSDDAGEGAYATQLKTTAKKPGYGASYTHPSTQQWGEDAGESAYANQLKTTAKKPSYGNPQPQYYDEAGEAAYENQFKTTAKFSAYQAPSAPQQQQWSDDAGEGAYASQFQTTAKKPSYGTSPSSSPQQQWCDEAGESAYANQLKTTAKKPNNHDGNNPPSQTSYSW